MNAQTTSNKADIIVNHLIEQIKNGELKPNDKIPSERSLATIFSTSRASVREAIQILAAKKYIAIQQGKNSIVLDYMAEPIQSPMQEMMSKDEKLVMDVMAVRHLLEVEATKLAAQNLNDKALIKIEAAFAHLQKADMKDYVNFANLDRNFHLTIADACGNLAIAQMMHSIEDLLFDHILNSLKLLQNHKQCQNDIRDQHYQIMQAIKAQKDIKAQEAATQHLEYVANLIDT